MVANITSLLSLLTLAADIAIALVILAVLLKPLQIKFIEQLRHQAAAWVDKHGPWLLFIIPLLATAGSLFFSEIAGYAPCPLCWYQRIFLYPQVILVATALIKKSRAIAPYLIPLSVLGATISVYQYLIQIQAALTPLDPLKPCSLDGTSCAARYFFQFGYITIPVMALSAFLLIIIISLIIKNKEEK